MIFCEEDMDIFWLEEVAKKLSDKNIELLFVDNASMREINLRQRGIDKTTDVLSFPLHENCENLLGSVVINLDEVNLKAKEFNHTQKEEITLLFIHALLHLLGYDHEKDNGEMRKKEQELIEFFKLPKSLIVRTQG